VKTLALTPNKQSPGRNLMRICYALCATVLGGLVLFQLETASAQTSPATLPDLQLSKEGALYSIVVQPDGKTIVGGIFTTVNGVRRNNIARLNSNGSVDLTWDPNCKGYVYDMALNGTELFICGTFNAVGGQTRNSIAKLSTLNSFADATWNPAPTPNNISIFNIESSGSDVFVSGSFSAIGGQSRSLAKLTTSGTGLADATWNPAPAGGGTVSDVLLNGSTLYVAGNFTSIGGQSRRGLGKVSTAGTGAADSAWNPTVNAFSGDPDIRLAIGGTNLFVNGVSFTNIGGLNRKRLAKIDANNTGAADPNWDANPTYTQFGLRSPMLVVGSNVYIAGPFTTISGKPLSYIAKLNVSNAAADTNWNPNVNSFVRCMAANGQALILGGQFQTVRDSTSLALAKVDTVHGTLDAAFSSHVQRPGRVTAIARQPDGKVIVGGDFWLAGNLPRRGLARINASGDLDAEWNPQVKAPVNFSSYEIVQGVSVVFSNIYVWGNYTNVGGASRNGLAKLSTTGSDKADAAWNPNANAGAVIYSIAGNGPDIFVGGYFTSIGGASRIGLAKLQSGGNGGVDTNWVANLDGAGYVQTLALDGTNLYVAGSFSTVKGVGNNKSLARVSATGSGAVDGTWNPNAQGGFFPGEPPSIYALAVNETNVFVAGSFNTIGGISRYGIAKLTAASGAAVSAWNPVPDNGVSVLMASGTNLYVSGGFETIGGQARHNLARLSMLGSGLADAFNPNPINEFQGYPLPLLINGADLYAGGVFTNIGGLPRDGFAFLPVADAPTMFQNSASSLVIGPNANDGAEITHFRITGITNVNLFLPDGVTPVRTNDFVTLAQAMAGLQISGTTGTVVAVSALNDTLAGAGTAATTLNVIVSPPATFTLAFATYSARESGSLAIAVKKVGTGSGSVNYTTLSGSASSGTDFQPRSGTLAFTSGETQKNLPSIAIGNDFEYLGDRVFYVSLSNASVGALIGSPARATVTILDDDGIALSDSFLTNRVSAALASEPTAVLKVSLQPTNAGGQWRLFGELKWHDSDATVSGLVMGNYSVEFRPANGYLQPNSATIPITAGQTNSFTFLYAATAAAQMGNLTVTIEPDDVATNPTPTLRGQWRRQGEIPWHDSGEIQTNLNTGNYSIEYKPVTNRLTPTPQLVLVGADADYGTLATYLVGPNVLGAAVPSVVPFNTAISNSPYRYNGQIQTTIGFGSGVVVKQRVVLTAAHVLFDDVQLQYTTVTRWFFQRYRDQLEPPPITPRGWYVFDGYASQRQLDNSPGISTPESQNLDIAAMYFIEDAGRGGAGGFLASDAVDNEFLTGSNNKFLCGYPLDGIAQTDQGKLFATTPTNVFFSKSHDQIYSTTQIASYPGNSGGPLYVQNTDGIYYPAGIFLGGSGQTLVRAINGEVVDLINRAELSGNGGGNSTGGGAITVSPGQTAAPLGSGLLTVNMTPSNTGLLPGWRIIGLNTNYFTDPLTTVALIGGGSYPVEFKPIPGYITPSNRTVTIAVGGLVTIQANYISLTPQFSLNRANGLVVSGIAGRMYRVDFATNFSSNMIWLPLTSFTLANPSLILSNTRPPTNGNRFYRVVLLP
jgi:hypothetical protein